MFSTVILISMSQNNYLGRELEKAQRDSSCWHDLNKEKVVNVGKNDSNLELVKAVVCALREGGVWGP